MANIDEASPTIDLRGEVELLDLEPTIAPGHRAGDTSTGPVPPSASIAPKVELVRGGRQSLTSETSDLRRSRLGSAAAFMACVLGVLLVWNLLLLERALWMKAAAQGLRFALALGVAALMFSRRSLTRSQVRMAELALFGGSIVIMSLAQYFVGLEFIRKGDPAGAISYDKNGLFHLIYLMIIYGMFIPNDAMGAAKAVLTMVLLNMLAMAALLEHPEATAMVDLLKTEAHLGSNLVFLVIGAALAIYGAHVLHGLRAELHQARRFGQYQLMSKLGTGGMGDVFLAEHQLLKRPCALKLIREGGGVTPVAQARFEREVRAAAQLSHPNSIEIYDYGRTDDGTFYYVMEYLPGMSLSDLVGQYGPLPPGRVVYLIRQACAGLAEAHALGLIHRDLKPGNIFVARRGGETDVTKVLDFGLVKQTQGDTDGDLTGDQAVSGTPTYMAPEQALGHRDLDARLDIYALGSIAYFALTCQPPFQRDSAMAIMIAHARDPVVPPSELVPGIPADLERVVMTCLAKDRDDRYPDVRALAAALAACECAGEWSAEQADRWWADHQPMQDLPAPQAQPAEA